MENAAFGDFFTVLRTPGAASLLLLLIQEQYFNKRADENVILY